MTDIDVAVCTFRRGHVADTLRSLAKLQLPPHISIRVIIADNDDTPSARFLVESTAQQEGLNFLYLHAPARNISLARNACLNASNASLMAFIDDDELAKPHWLMALLSVFDQTNADAVLGPVRAIYDDAAPEWMRKGDFHSTQPVWVDGKIITGYTCNVLINTASPAVKGRRFRLDLGRSGGEDTEFFSGICYMGGRLAFAPEALLTEHVPASRLSFRWLATRRFRSGQTHAMLLIGRMGHDIIARVPELFKACAKCAYCLGGAALTFYQKDRAAFWLLRASLHAGAISRLIGLRSLRLYGGGA